MEVGGKFPYKPRAAEEGKGGCIVNAELGWINHNSENSPNPEGQINFYFPEGGGGKIKNNFISFSDIKKFKYINQI